MFLLSTQQDENDNYFIQINNLITNYDDSTYLVLISESTNHQIHREYGTSDLHPKTFCQIFEANCLRKCKI